MNRVTETTVKCTCGCLFDVDCARCPGCGDLNPFSKRRCPNCNERFEISADTCPRCGARKFSDSVSCLQCGVYFPGHLKRCTHCNQLNTENFQMCDDCQTVFSSKVDSCPNCKVNGNILATCGNCGLDFDKQESRCPRCGLHQQKENEESGYIYILLNPAMQGHLKIGMTNRTPQERADELSSTTGVPTRFLVAHSVQVQNPERIELLLHTKLAPFRVNKDREFFQVTLEKAIEALIGVLRDQTNRQ